MMLSAISIRTKHFLLLFIAFLVIQNSALAQTPKKGKISGKIIDAVTGKAIVGANVLVIGTSKGAVTNLDGKYMINGIAPGTYTIRITYISYASKKVTGVQVKGGQLTALNTSLQSSTKKLDEITVTASANQNSEAGLLLQQRMASSVKDGISSQQIAKMGISNAASAMKRIAGVTIMGKSVFVRGLGNRYSNVLLNGSPVPSTNPNKKQAPIDLLGSSMVSNILVQKTYTADQPAVFAGGSVQITTKQFPSKSRLYVKYSTGYNTVSTFENTLSAPGTLLNFLGYSNGSRSLPAILKKHPHFEEKYASAFVRSVSRNWNISRSRSAIPSQKISVGYANQFNEEKKPIAVVGNFTYHYSRKYEPSKKLLKIQSYNILSNTYNISSRYTRFDGVERAKLSGMLNLFIKPSPNTKIGLKNLYSNALNNAQSIIRGSYYDYEPYITRLTISDFDRRAVYSLVLQMQHYMDDFYSSRLNISFSYNLAHRSRPDRRTTQYNGKDLNHLRMYFKDKGNAEYWMDLRDNNYTSKIDYSLKPFDFLQIKVGGEAKLKDRSFNSRFMAYIDRMRPRFEINKTGRPPSVLLSPDYVGNKPLEVIEFTNPTDSYNGMQHIYAGYISGDWQVSNSLSLKLGLRVESSRQTTSYLKADGTRVPSANLQNIDLSPAVNVKYSLTEKINIRGAFSKTLARPSFRQISDFSFQNFIGGQTVIGNPNLQRTKITNYDLRFEIYPSAGEYLSISAFYKHFKNPIAQLYRENDRSVVYYSNAKLADLYGIEIEARKNITPNFQFVANGSYIYSKTRTKKENRFRVANTKRAMYGQSPYIINVSGFYAIPMVNINLSAGFHTFGRRIITVGKKGQVGDEYEQPFNNLSTKINYTLGRVSISLEVNNLLNDSYVHKQMDKATYEYKPGITFELGVKFSF